jgi:hypothetical protein
VPDTPAPDSAHRKQIVASVLDAAVAPPAVGTVAPLPEHPSPLGSTATTLPVLWLGVHQASWLAETTCPLLLNRTRLPKTRFPRARAPWALDSGAFTELYQHGRWRITDRQWAAEVRRYAEEIGHLTFVAGRDWLCAPPVLARTGRSIDHHLDATVASFLELRAELGPLVIPTVQGWELGDYDRCVAKYEAAGIDLTREPLVGVGSLAGSHRELLDIAEICGWLGELGISRLHAWGVHSDKLTAVTHRVISADSMFWSQRGTRRLPRADCPHGGKHEGNCLRFALDWREQVLRQLATDQAVLRASLSAVWQANRRDPHATSWSEQALAELDRQFESVPALSAPVDTHAWDRHLERLAQLAANGAGPEEIVEELAAGQLRLFAA